MTGYAKGGYIKPTTGDVRGQVEAGFRYISARYGCQRRWCRGRGSHSRWVHWFGRLHLLGLWLSRRPARLRPAVFMPAQRFEVPTGFLTVPGRLTPEQADKVRARFEASYEASIHREQEATRRLADARQVAWVELAAIRAELDGTHPDHGAASK